MKAIYLTIIYVVSFMIGLSFAKADTPAYMKGGTITVTLTNGKSYQYSLDEYKVVKRGAVAPPPLVLQLAEGKSCNLYYEMPREVKKNIISLEVLQSVADQEVDYTSSATSVKTNSKLGLGGMYQRNVTEDLGINLKDKDVYMGIRADTNRGVGGNIGIGF